MDGSRFVHAREDPTCRISAGAAFGNGFIGMLFSSRWQRFKALCLDRARYTSARSSDYGRVAQLAEHSALNRQVEGSIPSASTIKFKHLHSPSKSQLGPFWSKPLARFTFLLFGAADSPLIG